MTSPLIRLLADRVQKTPDRVGIRLYQQGDWRDVTRQEQWDQAMRAAGGLRAAGVRSGDRVLILVPDVAEAVPVLFGLWALGATPVQVGLPYRLQDIGAFITHLYELSDDLDASLLVLSGMLAGFAAGQPEGTLVSAADLMKSEPIEGPADATGPALLQLTSGSTSKPRAVQLPADNLVAHLACITEALPAGEDASGVSWLPLYHDMGLIGGLLYPFYADFPINVLSPLDFRSQPYVWLQAMSEFRVTHTAAPPSAYALATRLARRAQRDELDLSALRCAMVGAEPIPPRVLRSFTESFAPNGFQDEAFFPVYGLAEVTVAATFPPVMAPTVFDRVDGHALAAEGRATPSTRETGTIEFTGVGREIPRCSVRVVDDTGTDVSERTIGEVWVRTETGMSGYYKQPEATAALYAGDWLQTGDLGYVAGDHLFITGRRKELIIRGGRNLVPTALEEVVGQVDGIRSGCVIAVGVRVASRATERAIVVAETKLPSEAHDDLTDRVQSALQTHGLDVDEVRLVKPGTLPKTTSGKLQRTAVKRQIEDELGP